MLETLPDVWHIVRNDDGYYALTVRGAREAAETVAANYRPNGRDLAPAHVVPVELDYPATVSARAHGDAYADATQRHIAELLSKGIDVRDHTLSELLRGNDGE